MEEGALEGKMTLGPGKSECIPGCLCDKQQLLLSLNLGRARGHTTPAFLGRRGWYRPRGTGSI